MHSVAIKFQTGWFNWETLVKYVRNTIQQAMVNVGGCGTDKSVPYAHVGLIPSNAPWWSSEVSERINAFPTNEPVNSNFPS